jgi:phosphate transport system substrate-binding protein
MTSGQGVVTRRAVGISKTILIIALIVVGALSGIGGYYFGGGFKSGSSVISVTGAGSTFAYPIFSAISGNFSKFYPNIQVNYQSVGSGAGISDFQAKTVDFGASDAPLSTTQWTNITNTIGTPLHIPATIGSEAIAYNLPGILTGLKLNVTVTAEIFQGNITTWNDPAIKQLNPTVILPSNTIQVIHRSDGSGTTFVFTSWLALCSCWKQGASKSASVFPIGTGAPGNEGVASLIQSTAYAIGYVELNYALSASPPMTYAAVYNHDDNYVLPSLATTAYAVSNSTAALPAGNGDWSKVNMLNATGPQTYPIASFTYILVYRELSHVPSMNQATAEALVNFLYFEVINGQQLAAGLSYVPLPPSVLALDIATLSSITFDGHQLPA